jgi:hypothetical protein
MFQKEAFLWEVSLSESLLWQSLLRSFCPCGVTAKRENIPAAVPAAAVRTPAQRHTKTQTEILKITKPLHKGKQEQPGIWLLLLFVL